MKGNGGRWLKRTALGGFLLVAVGGGLVAWKMNQNSTGRAFQNAATDVERERLASDLLASGEAGVPVLLEPFRGDQREPCEAVVRAMEKFFGELPADDPRYALWCRAMFDGFATFSDVGKAAALELVPEFGKCPDSEARCRDMVKAGLKCQSPSARVRSIRIALQPNLKLKADVVPLLGDSDAEVRRAAMLAVGPVADGSDAVIGDEELFRWLHDSDAEVRDLCAAALNSRGLDPLQVLLAKQLSHPNPSERLKLLTDLRYAGDTVKDLGPWLERLSRDADPAVRLGAARLAVESRLMFTGWLERLAESDPDPTVRKWVRYYRTQAEPVRQAEFNP